VSDEREKGQVEISWNVGKSHPFSIQTISQAIGGDGSILSWSFNLIVSIIGFSSLFHSSQQSRCCVRHIVAADATGERYCHEIPALERKI
jgi:hypothetical protein